MQDREQESIVVASTTEDIVFYDARTSERLDSEEVRKGRAKEVRELDEFEVKMEVDESEMRTTQGKNIWSKWVESGQNGLKRERIQTDQQFDVGCVPRK